MQVVGLILVAALCTTGGEADLSTLLQTFLKQMSQGCPAARDFKCPRDNITFWLYTRSRQDDPVKLEVEKLQKAKFKNASFKVIVHGYSVDKDSGVNPVLRPAYFAKGEYNIVTVDWSPLGRSPCYYAATVSLPTVAHCVAQFVNVLQDAGYKPLHLIGHSLGAHIAAQASQLIPDLYRLTEFDPALPLFDDDSPLLQRGVADYVDVYHSNVGLKGRRTPDGDVDVYFNNGVFQPGCGCRTSCSHLRAVEFYAESISGREMKAFPCSGWPQYREGNCPVSYRDLASVGEYIDKSRYGSYMMFTADRPPYLLDSSVYLSATASYNLQKAADAVCDAYDVVTNVLTILDQ